MRQVVNILLIMFFASTAQAEDRELAKLFSDQNINGTIVISALRGGERFTHNDIRVNRRFATASTFKILNSLISLEEQVISGKNTVLEWDGRKYNYPAWNADQTLESAFKLSCVWCFQELARRVGSETYRSYFQKLSYGKLLEPFNETTFWLDGSLSISAIEQVNFLKELYLGTLPFNNSSYEVLKDIMVVEQTPTFTIRAKTGWAERVTPQVGWYVGYVEVKDEVWFFATNIEISEQSDLTLRQEITLEALKSKGILNGA